MKIDKLINKVHNFEAIEGINKLPDNSIDMVMFSPPYFMARSYGTETNKLWETDSTCNHKWRQFERKGISGGKKSPKVKIKGKENYQIVEDTTQEICDKCGSWKGPLGLEPTLEMYTDHMTEIASELQDKVKRTGNWYLNLGDKYIKKERQLVPSKVAISISDNTEWKIREKIIWYKPNAIPHPVRDRLNNTYEIIFHFVLDTDKYYYDLDAIREPYKTGNWKKMPPIGGYKHQDNINKTYSGNEPPSHKKGKNPGDMFSINTGQSEEQHLAVYPIELTEKPIKSSCPEGGIVLDPMSGSGTSLIAAQKYNRQWIGFDINSDYVNISKNRIKKECSKRVDDFF